MGELEAGRDLGPRLLSELSYESGYELSYEPNYESSYKPIYVMSFRSANRASDM